MSGKLYNLRWNYSTKGLEYSKLVSSPDILDRQKVRGIKINYLLTKIQNKYSYSDLCLYPDINLLPDDKCF